MSTTVFINKLQFMTDVAYLVCGLAAGYAIDCCGYSTDIEFYRDAAGLITFQIWRPVGGTTYELIGTATDSNTNNNRKSASCIIQMQFRCMT